jgi:hypothetical protein
MAKRKRRAFTREFKAQAMRVVRQSGKSSSPTFSTYFFGTIQPDPVAPR